jgi:hypothetical protein
MNKRLAKVYRSIGPVSSRREFLCGAVAGAAALCAWPAWAATASKSRRSRVALLENPRVLPSDRIRPNILRDMLADGLCIAMRQPSPKAAWRSILKMDDRILIKCNRADARRLDITAEMTLVLIESLLGAGFEPEQITLLESPVPRESWGEDLVRPEWGWTEGSYDFGSGSEHLVRAVEEATAIINVPFLKAHRIAAMTGCLKNLSHGLIRRPALYHANQCCPYIPDIVAMPAIRQKLRLHVMNALRIIYDTRPDTASDPTAIAGALVVGTDPVATDTVGQMVLDAMRREKGLEPITPEPGLVLQHRLAAERGLGINSLEHIEVVRPGLY